MTKRKGYERGALGHIYQRTFSRYVIFYTVRDFLEFFMIFSLYAKKYRLRIVGICLMFDHIHFLVEADSQAAITAFIRDYTSAFSLVYNARYGLKGRLFESYGMANKHGDKAKRTAIAYVYNNPVEGKLTASAEKWPWNFLAYAESKHPFSEKLSLAKASAKLRRGVQFVKFAYSRNRPLTYEQLDTLFEKLDTKEALQLTDFIVATYSCIDHDRAIRLYGSYEKMLLAFRSNTGSEYAISEEYDPSSARAYIRMSNYIAKEGRLKNMGALFALPPENKIEYANRMLAVCRATPRQVKKFLHIPVEAKALIHRR